MIWLEKRGEVDNPRIVKPSHVSTQPQKDAAAEADSATHRAEHELIREALSFVGYSLRRLGVPDADRDDLAQEIVLAAYSKRQEYDPGRGSPRQWCRGFVVNFVRNYRRKKYKTAGLLAELAPDLADRTPSAEDQYVAEMQRRLLHDVLFPQVDFEALVVVIAYDLDELDFKTIAEQQEIPLSTAHARYQRGHEQLKAAYARHQRQQKAQGLAVMPLGLAQLLAADRTIPTAPVELVQRTWSRVERALTWRARWCAVRALLRRPEIWAAPTFLAGAVFGAVIHSIVQSTPPPAPVVFVVPTPTESAPVVAIGTASSRAPTPAVAALSASTSSAPRRDVDEAQRAFDVAHQAFDRGNLDAALMALAAHERDFPAGAFAGEREILRARIALLRAAGGPALKVDPSKP